MSAKKVNGVVDQEPERASSLVGNSYALFRTEKETPVEDVPQTAEPAEEVPTPPMDSETVSEPAEVSEPEETALPIDEPVENHEEEPVPEEPEVSEEVPVAEPEVFVPQAPDMEELWQSVTAQVDDLEAAEETEQEAMPAEEPEELPAEDAKEQPESEPEAGADEDPAASEWEEVAADGTTQTVEEPLPQEEVTAAEEPQEELSAQAADEAPQKSGKYEMRHGRTMGQEYLRKNAQQLVIGLVVALGVGALVGALAKLSVVLFVLLAGATYLLTCLFEYRQYRRKLLRHLRSTYRQPVTTEEATEQESEVVWDIHQETLSTKDFDTNVPQDETAEEPSADGKEPEEELSSNR